MRDDDIAMFWRRLATVHAGLLGTCCGAARMVPMCHQLRDRDTTIWYITARDTDLAEAAEQTRVPAMYHIADEGRGLFAVIEGDLILRNDPAIRDDLWSVAADSWFRGGKTDPKVCVLGLVPSAAEIWLTPASGLTFAVNVVRAQLTGAELNMGSHAKLSRQDLAQLRLSA